MPLTPTTPSLDKNDYYDSLRIRDHEETIKQQIESGENPNQIEEYITNVEAAFQVELLELRLTLTISIYNQDPSQFGILVPFMRDLVYRALNKDNLHDMVRDLYKEDFEELINFLNQVENLDIFYSQLESLKYGSPRIVSMINEAKKFKL
jgi:hypothetical protein